jgi:hypothetical protein
MAACCKPKECSQRNVGLEKTAIAAVFESWTSMSKVKEGMETISVFYLPHKKGWWDHDIPGRGARR